MWCSFCPWPLDEFVLFVAGKLSFQLLLHEGNEAVLLARCHIEFLDVLIVWSVLDPDHGALLRPWLKVEPFLFTVDVELDFFGPHIIVSIGSVEEGSPEDE